MPKGEHATLGMRQPRIALAGRTEATGSCGSANHEVGTACAGLTACSERHVGSGSVVGLGVGVREASRVQGLTAPGIVPT